MRLTDRSKEFLAALRKLCHEQSGPVHYEAVAKAVGVSKWTAYDMLRKLANDGLVGAEYILNRQSRTPGRSMVMFRPADDSDRASECRCEPAHGGSHLPFGEELFRIKRGLLSCLCELRSSAPKDLWQSLTEKLDDAKGPAAFCGYMVVLMLACARLLGGNSPDVVMQLTNITADTRSALMMFSGAIMGMLVVRAPGSADLTRKIAGYMREFQDHIDSLSGQDRRRLLEFIREIAGSA